jgi:prevent-host-death family protein
MSKIAIMGDQLPLKSISARDAKNSFGMLIDAARAEPVTIEKHGRPVVVVMSVEEYERLVTNGASKMHPALLKPVRGSTR